MGWQPIETAPKDGTEILAWVQPRTSRGFSVLARWYSDKFSKDPQPYWMLLMPSRTCEFDRHNQPTHWMPLPEPPQEVE